MKVVMKVVNSFVSTEWVLRMKEFETRTLKMAKTVNFLFLFSTVLAPITVTLNNSPPPQDHARHNFYKFRQRRQKCIGCKKIVSSCKNFYMKLQKLLVAAQKAKATFLDDFATL